MSEKDPVICKLNEYKRYKEKHGINQDTIGDTFDSRSFVPCSQIMYVQENTRRHDLTRSHLSNIRVDLCEFIKALGMEEQFIRENS